MIDSGLEVAVLERLRTEMRGRRWRDCVVGTERVAFSIELGVGARLKPLCELSLDAHG